MKLNSKDWKKLIEDGAVKLGVPICQNQLDLFAVYASELVKWNRKINITAITDPVDIAVKHFLDSIAVVPVVSKKIKLLDIGSGGGFPGIPLKIMMPSLSITLVDASLKKVNFMKHIIRTLKLENIQAVHERAEKLALMEEYSFGFDMVICRAFTNMERYVSMALPFLKNNGLIVAMKGGDGQDEFNSIKNIIFTNGKKLELRIDDFHVDIQSLKLPVLNLSRKIILMKLKCK